MKMNLERVLDSINVKIDEIHDQIYSEDLTLEKYDIIAKIKRIRRDNNL